jgi:hypothetical protein
MCRRLVKGGTVSVVARLVKGGTVPAVDRLKSFNAHRKLRPILVAVLI